MSRTLSGITTVATDVVNVKNAIYVDDNPGTNGQMLRSVDGQTRWGGLESAIFTKPNGQTITYDGSSTKNIDNSLSTLSLINPSGITQTYNGSGSVTIDNRLETLNFTNVDGTSSSYDGSSPRSMNNQLSSGSNISISGSLFH